MSDSVTLLNCDQEPIHVPGQIQPHGMMLAFEQERLVAWSMNAADFGCQVGADILLTDMAMPAVLREAMRVGMAEVVADGGAPHAAEILVDGAIHDLIVHGHDGRLVVELEQRTAGDDVSGFAQMAHRAVERLRRAGDLSGLMQRLVDEVRAMTGFDRVMAYRFRPDESGEVIAEARNESLASYLGMRFPATDIPAQARRLYAINTLRLIADVNAMAVSLKGPPDVRPLDMSHAVLRSVSPIHIEYLQNMGVGASMSVSIVIGGRLWGLIACHHMQARQVPYSVRMSCDVLAQVIAARVQTLEAQHAEARHDRSARVLGDVIAAVTHAEDVQAALARHAEELRLLLDAEAVICAQQSKLAVCGDLGQEQARLILATLPHREDGLTCLDSMGGWPESARLHVAPWAGALMLRYDPVTEGKVIALRREQTVLVRWAGEPDKRVVDGPSGPRLTPRGSFAEWAETVSGTSEPWDSLTRDIAEKILRELQRASLARHAETDLARRNLLAILGHDLRDPLQTIRMVAGTMRRRDEDNPLGQRLESSSGRMQRLISQVMDFSRAEAGLPMAARAEEVDLVALIRAQVEESVTGHPGTVIEADLPDLLVVMADRGRLEQVVGNLVSNARHHGAPGHPVRVKLREEDGTCRLAVCNVAPPISPSLVPALFEPFKRSSVGSERNRSGLGLGLYIVSRVIRELGGKVEYRYVEGHVVFEVSLPLSVS